MTQERTFTLTPGATALTIAGSDPSGGAGLQADLKTFQQLGVYGMSAVTLITVQNTQSVQRVEVLSPQLVGEQIDAVLSDIPASAVKTGALGTAAVVRMVAEKLRQFEYPIVVDPVLVSKHGHSLVADDVVEAYKQDLLPLATLVTPNRFEAERLTGISLDSDENVARAIQTLRDYGAGQVLIKLGEVDGKSHHMLSLDNEDLAILVQRLPTPNTHGTGCILSAAITAKFALGESDLKEAVLYGIHRTFEAIHVNTELGKGDFHPAETRAIGK